MLRFADMGTMEIWYSRVAAHRLLRPQLGPSPRPLGDPVAIAAYLGKKDRFDKAMADFSQRYADQNDQDYTAFCEAIHADRLEAVEDA